VKELKLGLQMDYWGAAPDPRVAEVAQQAEQLGYEAIFTKDRPPAWRASSVTLLLVNNRHSPHLISLPELVLG
jgi:alkanesulfonate monooxygenase SsuD/methylene tetrahydromethanopterin reductase-like flavin-dependent oxidoreductase (luciferase family)